MSTALTKTAPTSIKVKSKEPSVGDELALAIGLDGVEDMPSLRQNDTVTVVTPDGGHTIELTYDQVVEVTMKAQVKFATELARGFARLQLARYRRAKASQSPQSNVIDIESK